MSATGDEDRSKKCKSFLGSNTWIGRVSIRIRSDQTRSDEKEQNKRTIFKTQCQRTVASPKLRLSSRTTFGLRTKCLSIYVPPDPSITAHFRQDEPHIYHVPWLWERPGYCRDLGRAPNACSPTDTLSYLSLSKHAQRSRLKRDTAAATELASFMCQAKNHAMHERMPFQTPPLYGSINE